ncbi:response regulator [Mucilaginibacter sp. UR6-1]|uniref:hybrid sensor histidine kinase/response regulator n=1 Tax=Mucilaginibacter sp. UR6-1 TaxID=1435643 RepID=UPI001E2F293B|nr:ATP-binding protein [Mucilaginibacter sp. UR6-1]MCC8409251.1 response regulator [Mucilaginibacter sp. UR6-1]
MAENHWKRFMRSIKGKVVFAFLLACVALFLAWSVSRGAFDEMLDAVENISAPNDKLRIVNDLSRRVAQLDQMQRMQVLRNGGEHDKFFKETRRINKSIDTLQGFYQNDRVQLWRLKSLRKLLRERDKLFMNYLQVREKLVNNKLFSAQVEVLNELVDKNAKADSAAVTTEKKTSTTIIYPQNNEDRRGFFGKLFGKKKKPADTAYKVVSEQLNIEKDTVAQAIKDSIMESMTQAVSRIEKNQLRKSAQFINQEVVLANANTKLITQILSILKQVENEVVSQIEYNNSHAKTVVNTSVKKISLIMLAFFLITLILVSLILADISRSNRYRKELEEAKEIAEYHSMAKQRFLSNMSHEIRTPLQSIIGYAELIRQQEHPRRNHIEAIYQSSGHLMQIVDEVLDYNRIISGKFTFTNAVFNMLEVLNEVASVVRFQAEKKKLKLELKANFSPRVYVDGDAFRLKQVLYNLLGNAIKFTDEGSVRLAVTCVTQGGRLNFTFRVADTGMGMAPSDLQKIFNEFEQADNNRTQIGTGLGLTISKQLVEAQGGSIHVSSRLGRGSQFIFHLSFPVAAEPEKHHQHTAPPVLKAGTEMVWVVDDDNFILEMCSLMLTRHNISHRSFNSAQQVLDAAWTEDVKYILMDIRMPGMSGIELCKALRAKLPGEVQIYALTAQVIPQERESILASGFNGIVKKPFKEHELIEIFDFEDNDVTNEDIDLRTLEQMTFGDKDQLARILELFTEDTFNDINSLKQLLENYSDELLEQIALTVHRMAGRTAQIGAKPLAADLRATELELNKADTMTNTLSNKLLALIVRLQQLREQIRRDYLHNAEV